LNAKGIAKRVMQVKGGIHRYAEQYPDGHFKGKNYVFDDRVAVCITSDILSTCDMCNAPCDDYTHCINASCNKMFLSCIPCITTFDEACSAHCQTLLAQGTVQRRPRFKRVTIEQQTQHVHNAQEKPA
jgi:predicted sulfurtransferase